MRTTRTRRRTSGDFVKIEETRPLSRLKRWRLMEVVKKTALVPGEPKTSTLES